MDVKLEREGYVVVDGLVSDEQLGVLRQAAGRAVARARLDSDDQMSWPHVRVVGKQFPPWSKESRVDVWGVQHLLHPDLTEPEFAKWYASDALINAVTRILGESEESLQMGMLVEEVAKRLI